VIDYSFCAFIGGCFGLLKGGEQVKIPMRGTSQIHWMRGYIAAPARICTQFEAVVIVAAISQVQPADKPDTLVNHHLFLVMTVERSVLIRVGFGQGDEYTLLADEAIDALQHTAGAHLAALDRRSNSVGQLAQFVFAYGWLSVRRVLGVLHHVEQQVWGVFLGIRVAFDVGDVAVVQGLR